MSASDAALTCCGFAFSAPAAALAAELFAPGFGKGTAVLLVTVFAMARTSSRLKAMGFDAALRFRMLSRSAVFLDGFSMGGELFAGLPLGAALTAAGRACAGWAFFGAGFGAGFLADDLWFLAMGIGGS